MKPIIGITPSKSHDYSTYHLEENYAAAVWKAGGIPQILNYPSADWSELVSDYLINIDGLLLSGGVDPDPLIWGEQPIAGMGRINPHRDSFEIELIKQVQEVDIPILGICRGCQLINVALGGDIIQDFVGDENEYIKHSQDAPGWYPTHTVELMPDSNLAEMFSVKRKLPVNSFHHQSVCKLGTGLQVSAVAEDGVIEAIEDKTGRIVGVQWHPERMNAETGMAQLFTRLIKLSKF
ncbi:MAG: gamma-glutamyl-gamma-aminobutyrate hydrolase family protein [Bacillota bacterium]